MTLSQLRDILIPRGRRRAPKGLPELVERQHVALTATDLRNLQMIQRAACTSVTDSELIRALIRCAADDLLGGYDDAEVIVTPPSYPGGAVVIERRR